MPMKMQKALKPFHEKLPKNKMLTYAFAFSKVVIGAVDSGQSNSTVSGSGSLVGVWLRA